MTNEPKTPAERDYPPLPEPLSFWEPSPHGSFLQHRWKPDYVAKRGDEFYSADQMHAYYDLGREAGTKDSRPVLHGWRLHTDDSEGRRWLHITTPHGASASLSCALHTGNGHETIAAQVIHYLCQALAASPTAQAAPAAVAGPSVELGDYHGPDDTPHPVLLALSEHDNPCDTTEEAVARIAVLRAEIAHLRPFQQRLQDQEEEKTAQLAAEFWRSEVKGTTSAPAKDCRQAGRVCYCDECHGGRHEVCLYVTPATQAAPQPPAEAQEPLQAFDSPRAKALMRAWEEGWEACRDAEYVGEEAQNDAFNLSTTLSHCIAEDQLHPAPQQAVSLETSRFNPADGSPETALQMAAVIALRDGGKAVPTSEQAGAAVLDNKFQRAWIQIDQLPGTMMVGPQGLFGPIPASTSAWVTTSQRERDRCRAEGKPMLEVWLTAPASGGAAPVAEGDARQVGLIAAADYIDGLASSYAQEHSYTEPDTGAVVFDRRDAGLEYHSTLVELADDLRGMAARVQAKEGGAA